MDCVRQDFGFVQLTINLREICFKSMLRLLGTYVHSTQFQNSPGKNPYEEDIEMYYQECGIHPVHLATDQEIV